MLGIDYLHRLQQLLNDAHPSGYWMDKKTSFDFLYEAAKQFCYDTHCLTNETTITTVEEQAAYELPKDFLRIYTEDMEGKESLYYDSTWIPIENYKDIIRANLDPGTPYRFAITPSSADAQVTGTCSADSSNAGGLTTLTSATAFSADVGDQVINSAESYIGIVQSVVSTTSVTTAMFDVSAVNSTYADWTDTDTFVIQPAANYDLILDPAPDEADVEITVKYYCLPPPCYYDYGSYTFASGYEEALIKYVAWLYTYRDKKPDTGNEWFKFYDMQMRLSRSANRSSRGEKRVKVSFCR